MNREYALALTLVGWFALLAVAEAFAARRSVESTRSNDRRLLTNFGLTALVILCGSLVPLASSALFAEQLGIGLAQNVALPIAAVFLLTLIAQTLAAYWVHRLMHSVPLLWRVHRVHHCDGEVDVSTSFRNHPLELLLTVPASAAAILLVGTPVEVLAATQTFLSAALIWQHADIPLPSAVDRALARVIVTPRLHRLHHSPDRQTHDSNYGELLILWDQLFHSLNRSPGRCRVGLDGEPIRADSLLDQILSPLRGSANRPSAIS